MYKIVLYHQESKTANILTIEPADHDGGSLYVLMALGLAYIEYYGRKLKIVSSILI